jgi:hypothetical protein
MFLIRASGKVFSRPTKIPTFFITDSILLSCFRSKSHGTAIGFVVLLVTSEGLLENHGDYDFSGRLVNCRKYASAPRSPTEFCLSRPALGEGVILKPEGHPKDAKNASIQGVSLPV